MKNLIQKILRILARAIVKKYHPKIIGITGSVGKTSTKEAIFAVLDGKFRVRRNIKNYNNEIGLPLTVIGRESGHKSLLKWATIILSGLRLVLFKDKKYPEILILEMGADHPGDIRYLTDITPCDIGVLTALSPVHLEFFTTYEALKKEKYIIVQHLKPEATAILNSDIADVRAIKEKLRCNVLTFGIEYPCDVTAIEIRSKIPDGVQFKLQYNGSTVPALIHGALGNSHVMAALAAACVGISLGMNLLDIANGLQRYTPPAGRMRIIPGIKHTTIIDDSYNSSPLAAARAVEVLVKQELPIIEGRKPERFAVLGDMNELGPVSEMEHKKLGKYVAELGVDQLITVGEKAKDIAKSAIENGIEECRVFSFDKSEDAGRFLQDRIKEGDLILVKGSQNNIRLEKVVKEIMAEPLRAKELLVRQGPEWSR